MDFDKTMSFQVEREENTKTREILNTLAEKGFVYISGSGRGTKYHRK